MLGGKKKKLKNIYISYYLYLYILLFIFDILFYKFDSQIHLVTTIMANNNFIRWYSTTDKDYFANEDIIIEIEQEDGWP